MTITMTANEQYTVEVKIEYLRTTLAITKWRVAYWQKQAENVKYRYISTVNLLFACVRPNNVKRAVQAASSSAYGNTPLLPKIENMNPIPRSPYAASKL